MDYKLLSNWTDCEWEEWLLFTERGNTDEEQRPSAQETQSLQLKVFFFIHHSWEMLLDWEPVDGILLYSSLGSHTFKI